MAGDLATTIAKLDELLSAVRASPDPRHATGEWKQIFKLLQGTDLPKGRVTAVVGMRDVAGLAGMIDQLRAPAPAAENAPDAEVCRKALHAFRKRLSLTVLDEDSSLGHGPLSKGGGATAAIVPPQEWPAEVWRELVRQGKLRDIGHGLYELAKP